MAEGEPRPADTRELYTDTEVQPGLNNTWTAHPSILRTANTGTFQGATKIFRTDADAGSRDYAATLTTVARG